WRPMPLETSLSAPVRSAIRLSVEPVWSSAAWKRAASASAPIRIATTSATPIAVATVEAGLCITLRRLYESGSATDSSSLDAPQRVDDLQARGLPSRKQPAASAHHHRHGHGEADGLPAPGHRRQPADASELG